MPTIFELKYATHPDPLHTNRYASMPERDPERRFTHGLWFKFWTVKANNQLEELSEDAMCELRARIKEEHRANVEKHRNTFSHSVKVITSFREDEYAINDSKRTEEVESLMKAYHTIVDEINWSNGRLAYKIIGKQLDLLDADDELLIPKGLNAVDAYFRVQ